jgi:LysR family transcriptional regulator, carnitine catabolism transcriptional activator
MTPSLRQLQAFSRVAREGSFTRAAARLHLSQPALTVQIRALEGTLGAKLFDRNTREVRLTALGAAILPAVERLLRDLEALEESTRELAAGNRGVVRVAALPSIASSLLPHAIARLGERHPGIVVRLRDTLAQGVVALVQAEEVDLGLGVFGAADADLDFAPLLSDRLEAVLPRGHPLTRKASLTLKDVTAWPVVMMDTQTSVRALLEREMLALGLPSRPTYEVTYMSTAVGLVDAGLGIALLPTSALELQRPDIERRPVRGAALGREIGVITRRGRTLSPAAHALLEILREAARDFSRSGSPRARRSAASRRP